MAVIFVSYAREDRDRVAPIAGALEEHGWTVWWDRHIPPGRTFDEVIEEALDTADAVIAVWSEHGVASRWVRTEAAEGLTKNILVPVTLEDVRIPLAFRRIECADLSDWEPGSEHVGFAELVAALESLIGAGGPTPDDAIVAAVGATPESPQRPAPVDPMLVAILRAREQAAERDWEGVIDTVNSVEGGENALLAAHPAIGELLDEARRRQEAGQLYDEAEVLYGERRWHDVLSKLAQVSAIDPDHDVAGDLASRAQRHIDQERQSAIDDERARASEAMERGEWSVAIARLERLVEDHPDHDAAADLTRARGGLEQVHREQVRATPTPEVPTEGHRRRPWWRPAAVIAALVALLVVGIAALSTRDGGSNEPDGAISDTGADAAAVDDDMTSASSPGEDVDGERDLSVGIVFDLPGRGDLSFNDSAGAGADAASADFGVAVSEATAANDDERAALVDEFAATGSGLTIGVGFTFADAIETTAAKRPETRFAIIDSLLPMDNVTSVVFAEEQGSFVVGAAAALKSGTGRIGFIGGMESDLIREFEAGYVAGARAVNPQIDVVVDYISVEPDISGFSDPDGARERALMHYQSGVDVIFTAAGASGFGTFEAAHQSGGPGEFWAIGVDTDQYHQVPAELQPYVLTSMVKQVDVAVYHLISGFIDGNLEAGVWEFGIDSGAVGYTTSGGHVDDIRDELDRLAEQVATGTVIVPTSP